MLATLSLYIPYTHLPSTIQDHGLSPDQAALLISALGITNSLGRLLAGWMTDQTWANPLVIISAGITLAAPCLFFMTLFSQFWILLLVCILFGLMTGQLSTLRQKSVCILHMCMFQGSGCLPPLPL